MPTPPFESTSTTARARGMVARCRILAAVLLTASLQAWSATAGNLAIPPLGDSFLDSASVEEAVGSQAIEVWHCQPETRLFQNLGAPRIVSVRLARVPADLTLRDNLVGALLRDGANAALRDCPLQSWMAAGNSRDDAHPTLLQVDLYGPNDEQVLSATLSSGRGWSGRGVPGAAGGVSWSVIHDYQAEARAKEAANRADHERSQELWAALGAWLFGWIRLIVGVGLVILAIWKWEALLRFYYALRPHPAHGAVMRRVNGGGPVDGEAFADLMRTVPKGRVEQSVRAEQAKHLAETLRAASRAEREELERIRVRAVEEAAYLRAQDELRSSMEDHERAAARSEAARAWEDRNVR